MAMQLTMMDKNLQLLYDAKEEAAYRLHVVNRQLRIKRLELVPLEKDLMRRTLEVRSYRRPRRCSRCNRCGRCRRTAVTVSACLRHELGVVGGCGQL
jgi:hypothetical protein